VGVEAGVVLELEALGFDVDDGVRWMVCWAGFLAA
jgi:hypothetical protein